MKLFSTLSLLFALTILPGMELMNNGKPTARIHISPELKTAAFPSLRELQKMPPEALPERLLGFAVGDLLYHLKQMTGAEFELTTAAPSAEESAITIGGIAPQVTSDTGEAFRLRIAGNRIQIGGEGPLGLAYGIYELLGKLGCDWVMPGPIGEVIPQNPAPTVNDMDISEKPSFDIRAPWYSGKSSDHTDQEKTDFNLWKLRHKLQLNRLANPLIMRGGHVWSTLIKDYADEFKKNPEMLALVRLPDGSMTRKGPQLETTDPRVLNLFEDHIRKTFKKNNWSNNQKVCLGIGPADGGGYSLSAETAMAGSGRIDPMTGESDMTDILILLGNQLLEKLGTEFPNLHLGFYLYSCHADFPARYQPHPRLIIVLADISYSRSHSTMEKTSTRIYYKNIMEQWKNTPNVKFFRGYNWNLAENFLPYSKLKIWAEDLPMYHAMNIKGVYTEYSKAIATLAPSNYLEAALLWNINADPQAVLAEFCRHAYGAGAAPMQKYNRILTERQSKAMQEAGSFHSFHLIYDGAFVKQALQLFDEAATLAQLPQEKERIAIARFPVEQLGEFLAMKKLVNDFQFTSALEIFNAMLKARQEKIAENRSLLCKGSVYMLKRFYQRFIQEAAKYSSAPYQLTSKLPDRMITIIDPYNRGLEMGFADPELNDTGYLETKTFSTTWAAQGLIGLRAGSVWYRVKLPGISGNAGLFIGGADNIVRVYCNGRFVGEARGFAKPFLFDLTGTLSDSAENLLAIQVQRDGNSEIGTGGLIYPSFIFTGPRLEYPAKPAPENYRLLPGGAIEKIN